MKLKSLNKSVVEQDPTPLSVKALPGVLLILTPI
jgi:hypothetical protein